MIKKVLFILIQFCLFHLLVAQTNSTGSWNILNLSYNHNEKLGFFGEGQIRSLKFYENFHYYEYKFGINLKVHPSFKLTLAGGSYQTYREGGNFILPKNNNEIRIWPQFTLSQSIQKLKIEQRYRTEFRFTSNGYRTRFRYRFGVSYPFGKSSKGYQPFHINISDEIFFTDRQPYFERNRFQFALNMKVSVRSTIQAGFLTQFDYKINDETGRAFFVIGYYYEIIKKKITESNPTVND